ncbi:hypothetical protein AN958_06123 [Leucoagaricus sp. SymC.cos]|nr:hypothetical protein AN958_06123 [Leucoagaricus sp. SymC.cos]
MHPAVLARCQMEPMLTLSPPCPPGILNVAHFHTQRTRHIQHHLCHFVHPMALLTTCLNTPLKVPIVRSDFGQLGIDCLLERNPIQPLPVINTHRGLKAPLP